MTDYSRDRNSVGSGERRAAPRCELVFYLRVFDGDANRMLGHLINLSSDGLMLVSDSRIESGGTYRLRMILPREVLGRLELFLEVQSCWCEPDANPDFHVTGFRFLHLDAGQAAVINVLIEEFGRKRSRPPAA